MRNILFSWILAMVCAPNLVDAQPQSMFSLHPENSRYFQFRGKPTLLITSGEHYGLLLNAAFDYEAYFNELAVHRLNHSRIFSGVYREIAGSFGITENPLAPNDDHFVCPWARTDQKNQQGLTKVDLKRWNRAYFQRLKQVVQAASERDIVLEMTLFCPMYKPELWDACPMNSQNNVNQIGKCESTKVYTLENPELLQVQLDVAEKIVNELREFDNVYFEICNEPYFGGVTMQWQHRVLDHVQQVQADHDQPKLISVNVANKTAKVTSPHPAISLFNFHYCYPPNAVADNWELHKPIGENETGFRGSEDVLYRTEGWDFIVAGGALYNNLDYSFTASYPDGSRTDYKSPGGGSHALRKQLGILRRTIQALPLPHIEPIANVAKSDQDLVLSAIGKPHDTYLIYTHVPIPGKWDEKQRGRIEQTRDDVSLTLTLPAGRYSATQVDCQTGEEHLLPSLDITDDSPIAVTLKPFQTDVALVVRRERN